MNPLLTEKKLRGIEKRVKKRLIAINEYIQKYSFIFCPVEIKVREMPYFSEMHHYLINCFS